MGTAWKNISFKLLVIVLFVYNCQCVIAQDFAVLPPERQTMLQSLLQEKPLLAELVTKAGLSPYMSGETSYTLFAPADHALTTLQALSQEQLQDVLEGHIVKGVYLEADLKDGATLETMAGTKISICRKKKYTLVSGTRILAANKTVKNGVIHTLDGFLHP